MRQSKSPKDTSVIRAVERAFQVLECIGKNGNNASLTTISKDLDLGKSTVFNILSTLEKLEYVKQEEVRGKYTLGLKLFELGQIVYNSLDVKVVARPYLEELVGCFQETAHLACLMDGKVFYLDKVDSRYSIGMLSKIGGRGYAHCSAIGKVLLSQLSEEEIDEFIQKRGLVKMTDYTICDPVRFKEHLQQIRETGIAYDEEEIEIGLRCVAAPIYDYNGKVMAAISIAGPTMRMRKNKVAKIAVKLQETVRKISSEMGYKN